MKISLISWSVTQLAVLTSIAKAQGYEVVQTQLRDTENSLQNLLYEVTGNVLVVECNAALQKKDLGELESFISEKSHIVVLLLSENRDADTLVAAMQSGIREVIFSPTNEADFAAALKRVAQRKETFHDEVKAQAKTVAFVSCKGGSGATFLATNFAYILAEEMGKNTAFLDLDLQCGDAVYYVSPGPSKSDIIEITRQIERLDAKLLASSVLHVAPNFDLLPAPEEPDATYNMSATALKQLVDIVRNQYDMVVMDLERVFNPMTTQALDTADVIYIVMENLLPFVRDAKRIVAKCRALGYSDHKIRLVVNRYELNGNIDITQIEKAVGLKVSYTIRSSFPDVAKAINTGVPIIHVNAKNSVVDVLRNMAEEFSTPKHSKQASWWDRITG